MAAKKKSRRRRRKIQAWKGPFAAVIDGLLMDVESQQRQLDNLGGRIARIEDRRKR
jgi:hypothetical protein